jgi:hypothetical protein
MAQANSSLSLDQALALVKAAGYRVTRPKRKLTSRGPTCVVTFADGVTARMTRTYLKIIGCCRCAIKVE